MRRPWWSSYNLGELLYFAVEQLWGRLRRPWWSSYLDCVKYVVSSRRMGTLASPLVEQLSPDLWWNQSLVAEPCFMLMLKAL